MKLKRIFRIKKAKGRKYPIVRDDRGRSLRERCFEQFGDGISPVEVANDLETKKSTVYRYFQQWRQRGPTFEKAHAYTKSLLRPGSPDRDQTLEEMALACQVSKEEIEAILSKPHGLKRLMTGKIQLPGHVDAHHKLQKVLEVALFLDSRLAKYGMTFEDVRFAFDRLMRENMAYRKEEDAYIKEENRDIEITRSIIEGAAQADREGRPRCDRLTGEEQMAVIRIALETKLEQKMRSVEIDYFIRIAELMAGGLTKEQAREKIYQDLIDKGDTEGARLVRQFQDKVHPLKSDNQTKPPPQPQPP